MLLANRITLLRIFLSPLFFIVYMFPSFYSSVFPEGAGFPGSPDWTAPVLWLIFIGSAISDMLDGMVARRRNETSDFGKLFDPFADTLMQITCFLCFVLEGIFPAILFVLVLYREFGILLLRNMMMKKGVAMGARIGGKIKTVTYILAAGAALAAVSIQRLGILDFLFPWFKTGALVIFIISVVFSLFSFFDYVSVYRKTPPAGQ
jgi:CDP-diacylglycerol--glycerol-3-phosphate 3-phosphatidyltransferase